MMPLLANRWSQMKSCVKRACIKQPSFRDIVFKLHAKLTRNILAFLGIAVFIYEVLGEPIHCTTENNMTSTEQMNSYCWASQMFRLPKEYKNIATDTVYKSYYHWIPLVLFVQALSFFLPFWLCSSKHGRCRDVATLNDGSNNDKSGYRRGRCFINKKVFFISFNIMVLCQVFNIFNLILNLYLMKVFFGNAFFVYGLTILSLPISDRNDTMSTVLPRKILCSMEEDFDVKDDVICTLPINGVSEKIYVILWLWFVVLLLVSVVEAGYNIVQCSLKRCSPKPSQPQEYPFSIPFDKVHFAIPALYRPDTQDFVPAFEDDYHWFMPRHFTGIETASEASSTNPEAEFNLRQSFRFSDMDSPQMMTAPERHKDGEKTPQVNHGDVLFNSDIRKDLPVHFLLFTHKDPPQIMI